jgi:F-type H+-transporting ATPase subunit beta
MKSSREMRNNSRASNSGVVVTVRGSVVDMRFDAQLPPIYALLRAGEKN